MRAGAEVGRNQDEWPGRTEEIIPTMRRALPDADLLIDANSCYSPERAIEVGRMLEGEGFCHYEEPCPYWELEQTKQVTDALSIDVTGGEQDCDLPTWKRMIDIDMEAHDRHARCRYRSARCLLPWRSIADAAGVPHGGGGRSAGDAALREPIDGERCSPCTCCAQFRMRGSI